MRACAGVRGLMGFIVLVINNEHLIQKFKDLQKGGHLSSMVTIDSLAVSTYWMKVENSHYIKMRDYKQNRIDKYFYGKNMESDLIRSKPLSFKHFQIYCAKEAVSEGISAAGVFTSSENITRELLMPAPISSILKGHILAILHSSPETSAVIGSFTFWGTRSSPLNMRSTSDIISDAENHSFPRTR